MKLDKAAQLQINKFLLKLEKSQNPYQFGAPLKGIWQPYWRYRVGDYRLICRIEDANVTVFVLRVKHRKEVYKKPLL